MLKGSLVALVTPFLENGNVNFDKLAELIEYHINNDTDGLVILGTTGEASTIPFEEAKEVVRFSIEKVNKRIPVIIGAGSNDTKVAVLKAKAYSELGADYLLVVTPYYNKTNTMGLIKHYEAICEASSCPIILYNVPGRTGMNIPIKAIEVLADNPKIVGIKEASGNMEYAKEVAKYLNDNFIMYSGNDDIIPNMMEIGAKGVISVLANIAPKQTSLMCKLCLENRYNEAFELQGKLLAVANSLFYETNPIPVKAAMNYFGFGVGGYHLPLYDMDEVSKNKMIDVLENNKELIF